MDRFSFLLDLCYDFIKEEMNLVSLARELQVNWEFWLAPFSRNQYRKRESLNKSYLECVKSATYALLQRKEKGPFCATYTLNQYIISVWCEFASKFCDDCFHKLVAFFFLGYLVVFPIPFIVNTWCGRKVMRMATLCKNRKRHCPPPFTWQLS
jgi:hypothetical protein